MLRFQIRIVNGTHHVYLHNRLLGTFALRDNVVVDRQPTQADNMAMLKRAIRLYANQSPGIIRLY